MSIQILCPKFKGFKVNFNGVTYTKTNSFGLDPAKVLSKSCHILRYWPQMPSKLVLHCHGKAFHNKQLLASHSSWISPSIKLIGV